MAPPTDLDNHYRLMNPGKTKDFRTFSAAAKVLSLIKDVDKSILDIGCGFGILVAMATLRGKQIIGIDTSRYMIEGSQAYLKHLELKPCLVSLTTIEALLEQGERFEVITMIDVLEHIEDPKRFLLTVESLLAPGGSLILSVPAHQEFYDIRDERLGHFRRYDLAVLLDHLAVTQLDIQDTHYWNFLGWAERKFRQRFMPRVDTRRQYAFRYSSSLSSRLLNRLLRAYFLMIENRVRPVCGLSIILVARKPG